MTETTPACSRSNHILAALCHLSGLIPLYGLVFNGVVYALYRKKSGYVASHAAQAGFAQVAFLAALLIPLAGLIVAHVLHVLNAPMDHAVLGLTRLTTGILFIASWITFTFAAFRVVQGEPFVYPVAGDILKIKQSVETTET